MLPGDKNRETHIFTTEKKYTSSRLTSSVSGNFLGQPASNFFTLTQVKKKNPQPPASLQKLLGDEQKKKNPSTKQEDQGWRWVGLTEEAASEGKVSAA